MATHAEDSANLLTYLQWLLLDSRVVDEPMAYNPTFVAQFIGLCSRSKWSKHRTKSIFLAWLAMAGSNVAYKIISACSNTVR